MNPRAPRRATPARKSGSWKSPAGAWPGIVRPSSGSARDERVPNAAEPAAARLDVRVEHVVEVGRAQVGVADERGDEPAALVRGGGHELALADRRERRGTVGAVRREALHEHGRLDAVTGPDVGEQLGDRVGQYPADGPQVVMRVDDPAVGVDDVLDDERVPLVRCRGVGSSPNRSRPPDPAQPRGRTRLRGRDDVHRGLAARRARASRPTNSSDAGTAKCASSAARSAQRSKKNRRFGSSASRKTS